MQVVCYLYQFETGHWVSEPKESTLYDLASTLNAAKLLGKVEGEEYGFYDCGTYKNYVYGYFIQHFVEELEKYDKEKKLQKRIEVNSAKYLFYIDFRRRQFLLQAHSDSNLPTKSVILERFITAFNKCMKYSKLRLEIVAFKKATIGTSKEEIVNQFYNTSGRVIKVSVENFDKEADMKTRKNIPLLMKEIGRKFINNIDKMDFKARKYGDLRKVPVVSYILERSKNPTITIYEGENRVNLVPKKDVKLKINIAFEDEGFIDLIDKAERELTIIGPMEFEKVAEIENDPQIPLFEFGDDIGHY